MTGTATVVGELRLAPRPRPPTVATGPAERTVGSAAFATTVMLKADGQHGASDVGIGQDTVAGDAAQGQGASRDDRR